MIDNKTGIWVVNTGPSSPIHNAATLHKYDTGLNDALLHFLTEQDKIVDFGCGNADYSKNLIKSGKTVDCYDGNPHTPEMTGGLGKVLDLSEPFDLGEKYECVISLEVGEHIPKEKEQSFLDNIANHSSQCIILSWALPGQGGDGHFNEQPNEYVISEMEKRNFTHWEEASNFLRTSAKLWWFNKTIMVFIKS
jgi:hypothetical protein